MKAYSVKISNGSTWYSTDAIGQEFWVFAEDITEALVVASDIVGKLKQSLVEAGASVDPVETIQISDIHAVCEVVNFKGICNSDLADDWVHRTIKRLTKEKNIIKDSE